MTGATSGAGTANPSRTPEYKFTNNISCI